MPEGVCGGDGVCVCVDAYLHSYCSVGQVGGWEEAGALSWVQCAVPRLCYQTVACSLLSPAKYWLWALVWLTLHLPSQV